MRSAILHPFLFAAFFVLVGFRQIQPYASLGELLLTLFTVEVATIVFVLFLSRLTADIKKSAVLFCVGFMPVLFYGEIKELLMLKGFNEATRYRYLGTFSFVTCSFLLWKILKTSSKMTGLNQFLNVVSLVYVLIEVANISIHRDNRAHQYLLNPGRDVDANVLKSPEVPPDLYYIVLDSYTSSRSLKEFWGYDNSIFVDYLKNKGFYIVENAKSNYNITSYSIASSMNMCYLNIPYELKVSWPKRVIPFRREIRNCKVALNFKSLGYNLINLSPFDILNEEKFYDFEPLADDNFFLLPNYLFKKTLPGRLRQDLKFHVDPHITLKVLTALQNVDARKSPCFVYAHIMLPHDPFFFDRDGRIRSFIEMVKPPLSDPNLYLEQVIFTNKMMIKTVDTILAHSKTMPIIILQGDHGSRTLGEGGHIESSTILHALRLPDQKVSYLYNSMTPVNSFRAIFDTYFNGKYGLLKDEVFVVDNQFNTTPLKKDAR